MSRADKGRLRGISPLNRARLPHYLIRRQERLDTLPERMAAARCRQLTGAEFERRKAELEARDRAERERADEG